MSKNPAAIALGKLGKGKPKKYSKDEIKKRTLRLLEAKKTIFKRLRAQESETDQ